MLLKKRVFYELFESKIIIPKSLWTHSNSILISLGNHFVLQVLKVNRARSLDRKPEDSGPDEIGHCAYCSSNSKNGSIILIFFKSQTIEQNATMTVYVWIRIFHFWECLKLVWNNFGAKMKQANHLISSQVFFREIKLIGETRICLSKNSMAVAWHNFSGIHAIINVLFNLILWYVKSIFFLNCQD